MVAQGWAQAAQAAGWQAQLAHALFTCGALNDRRGESDAAVDCYQEARRVAVAAGDFALGARAMAARAQNELVQGRHQIARRRAETACQLARCHRASDAEARGLEVMAHVAARAGDWHGMLAAAQAGMAAAERGRERLAFMSPLLLIVSDAQNKLGRPKQAREAATRALDLALHTGQRFVQGSIG